MGKALYRKYRSKSLSEIVGQKHITDTLANAIQKGNVSHAYLFTGPRGVGKTSIARILAYELNGFPYDEETVPVDIIEIDAASNRRIDEIRNLRDKVHIAPVAGKYKVYIIDEVHMLTREAFNALLKTLEEPPAHAIFILATTEVHKLPETIVSRTQRYTFRPISVDDAISHLRHIASTENIKIDDEALALIASHGQGSFRDSISLLDQLAHQEEPVVASTVRELLGIAPEELIDDILAASVQDERSLATQLVTLQSTGYDAATVASQIQQRLRSMLIANDARIPRDVVLKAMEQLLYVPAAPDPQAALEICLFTVTASLQTTPQTTATLPSDTNLPAHESTTSRKHQNQKPAATVKSDAEAPAKTKPKPQPTVVTPPASVVQSDLDWEQCLNEIKKQYNTLYGVLRMADARIEDDTITLAFKFGFHQKKIADKKHTQLISDIITQQCGKTYTIHAIVIKDDKDTSNPKPASKKEASPDIANISNIFGGAEVLE